MHQPCSSDDSVKGNDNVMTGATCQMGAPASMALLHLASLTCISSHLHKSMLSLNLLSDLPPTLHPKGRSSALRAAHTPHTLSHCTSSVPIPLISSSASSRRTASSWPPQAQTKPSSSGTWRRSHWT
eukprot:scaffold44862_cov19-Tisochrysis_lutea.AAC.3